MQLYFMKATYTNNVYKLADFFLDGDYKLNASKMLDINFKPDDGLTSFITKNITLPDETSVRDNTHIIIPSYGKIYRIASIDYLNSEQWLITLDEDPFIANYLELETKDIFLQRTNDSSLFRGVHDIADLGLKETVEVKVLSSTAKTGKWALLFFQYDSDNPTIGLKFKNDYIGDFQVFSSLANVITAYPEETTTSPELYSYFQKCVYVTGDGAYQCVYDGSGTNTRLKWVEYTGPGFDIHYFNNDDVFPAKLNKGEVMTSCIALPLETDIVMGSGSLPLLSFDRFVGPTSTNLIDIKIVNDLMLDISTLTYSLSGTSMTKTIVFTSGSGWYGPTYEETSRTTPTGYRILSIASFKNDIAINFPFTSPYKVPGEAEPFYKYDLYVYGKKYTIPYYLFNSIKLLIAINSGVINYLIYYNSDKRNVLASGSFTHSVKYQIDQLDAFYSQNPTYKDAFFTKMATDSMKNVVGGAVAGSIVPGIGTALGAVGGLVSSAVDAGLSMINLGLQEKGMKLKPDQVFGESSEISLQLANIFGIYWVKRTPENIDLMLTEYYLKGFPTSYVTAIEDLDFEVSVFGTSKVVFGEIKEVIRNTYITGFINQKLKEGVILIP